MKKIITLLVIFLASVGTLRAQNQKWWGYIGEDDKLTMIGIGQAATYHCAIFVPGNHDATNGKSLRSLSFLLTAPHATNVKAWTASSLPSGSLSASNTLWMTDVEQVEQNNFTSVTLETPYTIPAEGVYVGYSFTISSASTEDDQYPVVVGGQAQVNGLLLRTNNGTWYDYYEEGFGVLSLRVLLEGQFANYAVSPSMVQDTYYAQIGQSADVDIALTNNGTATINNVAYTLTVDGVTTPEQTVTLSEGLATFKTSTITINVPAAATSSKDIQTVTITKVNGEANQSMNPGTQFTLNTMERLIPRNIVVEEFTGTGCGYCPRGLVGMEKLRQTFGDRFIGIGIHQYNSSDAMYIANYPNLNFSGAPSCRINRGKEIDPYYGSGGDVCDDFRMEMNIPAMVNVDVKGTMNEAMTEVEATAYIEPLYDSSDYTLELALVADGLSGTTSAWWQSNYYYNQPSSSVPDDMKIFCSGGKYGSSSVKGFVFNDVAVGTSYNKNGVNQVEALGTIAAGETREVSFTLSLPTKATLRNALKKGTIYVVALVIDKDGLIANAAKRLVGEDTIDGVSNVSTDFNTETTVRYSLNGMQLTTPQRGINIVRMADGNVRKVVVK